MVWLSLRRYAPQQEAKEYFIPVVLGATLLPLALELQGAWEAYFVRVVCCFSTFVSV